MTQERKTTSGAWTQLIPPDPLPPPGEGWRLEAMACAPPAAPFMGVLLVWSWVRDAAHAQQCQNPKRPECRSVAFKGGKCVGCGWEQAQA